MKAILNGLASKSFHYNSWLPQSSILDRTLFLTFITDHPNVISYQLFIYSHCTKCERSDKVIQEAILEKDI